jgi:hypothetical protein
MFSLYLYQTYERSPPELIKATVIIIKSITDTVLTAIDKSHSRNKKTLQADSTPVRKVRNKYYDKIQAT